MQFLNHPQISQMDADFGPFYLRNLCHLWIIKSAKIVKGIIRSQTNLYLTMALSQRADCYWWLGYVRAVDTEFNCKRALEDYIRAEQLIKEWDLSVQIMYSRFCQCYLEVGMFAEAISIAEAKSNESKTTDNFELLCTCYHKLRDYPRAINAATEAIKYARNNHERFYAWRNRGSIYEEMGQQKSADQDYQTAESFHYE